MNTIFSQQDRSPLLSQGGGRHVDDNDQNANSFPAEIFFFLLLSSTVFTQVD